MKARKKMRSDKAEKYDPAKEKEETSLMDETKRMIE